MQTAVKLKAAAVAALVWVAGGAVAQAQISISTVTVGDAGNAADASTGGLYGSVNYSYAIGTTEVTNAQYAAFLNAVAATDTYGLYNTNMGTQVYGGITQSGSSGSYTYSLKSGYENRPVNYVSFWDAARFANWLNNGQGSASTEVGSYTLTSAGISANSVTRNAGANWVVTSENEWYKAAYYDPAKNSGAGGYWTYATRSDTLGNNTDYSASNGANYYDGDFAVYTGSNDGALPVGSYANATSAYGTLDQSGNVWEWNDTQINNYYRGLRGGAWNGYMSSLASSYRVAASAEEYAYGFRVASLAAAAIPEPSTYGAAMGVMTLGVVMMRRRKARGTL